MSIYESNCDFNKYKMFYAVAECKSFSKAANILHISQPAISYAVKELEKQLNTKLLIRENKNVVLTSEGKKLIYYIEQIFANILLAEKTLKESNKKISGEIRLGIYSHISTFIIPKIVKKFKEIYPETKFYIYSTSYEEMTLKLKNKELDFIILQFPIFINNDDYEEKIIFELDTCFYANKEIYDNTKLGNLKQYSLILPERGFNDIDTLEKSLKEKNISLKCDYRIYTSELAKEITKEGLGISYGVKKCIEKELNNKELYEVPLDVELPKAKFSVAYNSKSLDTTSKVFLSFLIEEIKQSDK